MAQPSSVKVVECCRISLPRGFIPQPSLPLTFFDLKWLPLSPVQRLFFYTYSHTNTYFMDTTLPNIKQSLSSTLQHYYPFAGTLEWPQESPKPHIQCSVDDFITLTIAESNQDFDNLAGSHARDANEFYPLVPKLPSSTKAQDHIQLPLMALQITLFPNIGISIGITFLHVISDGRSLHQFIKSWATVCKSGLGDDTSCLVPESLPFYDRSVIIDPNHVETNYLNELVKLGVSPKSLGKFKLNVPKTLLVRATFAMSRPEILKIKRFVIERFHDMYGKDILNPATSLPLSTFVLTCAYIWVCMIKVLANDQAYVVDDGASIEHFLFNVDCREKMNPPIPTTYFGNSLVICFVEAKRSDLVGEHGIAIAAEAIGKAIQRMKEGVLTGAENYFTKILSVMKQRVLSVAGSPNLSVYGTDFGCGTPKKSEVISIDGTGAMSLSECPNGEGGVEIGLVLTKPEMDAFASLFTFTLSTLP